MGYTISEIHPADRRGQKQVDALLRKEGIRRDQNLDYTCGLFDDDYDLLATGSTFGPTLRCFAVDSGHQGEGLMNQVISHLMERQMDQGVRHLFVYTKCGSAKFFQDLGFYEIARVEGQLSFLENQREGFRRCCDALSQHRRAGRSAAVVMNANPFTLGHLHLVERAARENDTVHLFVLSEDASLFPFDVRWGLVTRGVAHLSNVICHQSGPYMISAATFPSYFQKDAASVIESHARLDLALFQQVAQALGVTARYVGEEPTSMVTGLYNQIMAEELPRTGIDCIVVPRLALDGQPISASAVRNAIQEGRTEELQSQLPPATWAYLRSPAARPIIETIQKQDNVTHY